MMMKCLLEIDFLSFWFVMFIVMLKDHLQISLLILSEFKQINDSKRNISSWICLKLVNIRSKILR